MIRHQNFVVFERVLLAVVRDVKTSVGLGDLARINAAFHFGAVLNGTRLVPPDVVGFPMKNH